MKIHRGGRIRYDNAYELPLNIKLEGEVFK